MSFDPVSYLMGKKAGGGGGGNPNYVETIEGTLANPWGDYAFNDIMDLVSSRNATLILSFIGAQDYACEVQSVHNVPRFFVGYRTGIRYISVVYTTSGVFSYARSIEDEVTIADGRTACTLTIIHHPLPDSGT